MFQRKDLKFKNLTLENLKDCHILESNSYPEDEAASKENLKFRIENANELFIGCFLKNELIGFICR